MQVYLKTKKGEHVVTGITPPFNTLPDVLIWGERVFSRHSEDEKDKEYRECFAIAVVETVELRGAV